MIDFNVQIKLPSGDSINVKELKNKTNKDLWINDLKLIN
jgi:hypothetical protein